MPKQQDLAIEVGEVQVKGVFQPPDEALFGMSASNGFDGWRMENFPNRPFRPAASDEHQH